MRHIIIVGILAVSAGCATIGPEHAGLAGETAKGIASLEGDVANLNDKIEEQGRDIIDLQMTYVDGPIIMMDLMEKHADKFNDKVCQESGELDRATVLLAFTQAAHRSYVRVYKEYEKPLKKYMRGLRKSYRKKFTKLRQATTTLKTGLDAYNKGKKMRQDMLKAVGLPVDGVDALNKAAAEFKKKLEAGIDAAEKRLKERKGEK